MLTIKKQTHEKFLRSILSASQRVSAISRATADIIYNRIAKQYSTALEEEIYMRE